MGTDIHGVFQRHDAASGRWLDVPTKYEEGRHYQLFAVLAGVRNGTGFAGVKMGEAVMPIAEPRGLPEGFTLDDELDHPVATLELIGPRRAKWHEVGEPFTVWMGDHSHSWLSGDEMLAWAESAPVVRQCGVIGKADYEKWDHKTRPESYCGSTVGPSIVTVEQAQAEAGAEFTHVRVYWHQKLSEELAYFFDEVARLVGEHGKVRFVFGFDS